MSMKDENIKTLKLGNEFFICYSIMAGCIDVIDSILKRSDKHGIMACDYHCLKDYTKKALYLIEQCNKDLYPEENL